MNAQRRRFAASTTVWWGRAAIAIAAGALVSGCTSSTDGGAHPAPDEVATTSPAAPTPAATTTAPTPTPALVPADAGSDLLLKRSELGDIIGDTDVTETKAYTEPPLGEVKIEPFPCTSRVTLGQTGVSGEDTTVTGNANLGAHKQAVGQMVSIFEDPAGVSEALWLTEDEWNLCRDGDIFFIEVDPRNPQRWVPYPVSNTSGRLATTSKRDGRPRNCHHITVGKANVLVESQVCGDGDSAAAANTIADRILARIPG